MFQLSVLPKSKMALSGEEEVIEICSSEDDRPENSDEQVPDGNHLLQEVRL